MSAAVFADEFAFQDYLTLTIGPAIEADLGMTTVSLQMAVQDALLDVGATDISAVTDLRKLRAWGKYRAWEWIANQYTPQYRSAMDGQTLDRQQKWEHAVKMRDAAKVEINTILDLELTIADAEGSFDWAEIVTGPFGERERLSAEYQRGSF